MWNEEGLVGLGPSAPKRFNDTFTLGIRFGMVPERLMRDPGILLVVSGPSGSGKSTLCKSALNRYSDLEFSVSYTTRTPRVGEVEGRDYHFVNAAAFDAMVAREEFVEWAVVHSNKYGTAWTQIGSRLQDGKSVMLDIDSQGAAQVKKRYPEAVLVFVAAPSLTALQNRLFQRNSDSEEVIQRRLQNSISEMQQCTWYDYVIVNDDLNRAEEQFTAILRVEQCRRSRSSQVIAGLMTAYGILRTNDSGQ